MDINKGDLSPNVVLNSKELEDRVKKILINIVRKHGTDDFVDICFYIIKSLAYDEVIITSRLDLTILSIIKKHDLEKNQEKNQENTLVDVILDLDSE